MKPRVPARQRTAIPIVDIFAGPGGLSEGFSAFEEDEASQFEVRLSIEKDPAACATLMLRKYFRQFATPPEHFSGYYSGQLKAEDLFGAFPEEARRARDGTWQAELGKVAPELVAAKVKRAIGDRRDWVLLGGPPCQAYSVAGRSRMRKTHVDFEKDERHFLYQEYLRIVADHEPAVFILENVKGLLTSTHGGSRIVSRILDDLTSPGEAVGTSRNRAIPYRLYSLGSQQSVLPWMEECPPDGEEFLLQAEHYGIPQMRHRLFIVGVRSDVPGRPEILRTREEVSAGSVLSDLPPIRSALSREDDSLDGWRNAISAVTSQEWMSLSAGTPLGRVARAVRKVLLALQKSRLDPGHTHSRFSRSPSVYGDWFRRNATGITHHVSRSHMREDLHRYLFSACFAEVYNRSPKLRDFPEELHPSHQNIARAVIGNLFDDRFRVQLADRPSTTITAHASKDGHYYIHYDPTQCRSLTVREAARLQTFPDSYFFEGGRTEQYAQVGNAVPPLLAREIARAVYELLSVTDRRSKRRAGTYGSV